MLITNYLSVYKKVYKIFKRSTLLITNDLSVYINVKVVLKDGQGITSANAICKKPKELTTQIAICNRMIVTLRAEGGQAR